MALIWMACLAFSAACGYWIFSAAPEPPGERDREIRIDLWRERRKAAYDNLKDLHFEHLAGKLSPEDFERTRAMLEREAATAVQALAGELESPHE